MGVESATDIAGFFNTDEFGIQAKVNGSLIDGAFFNGYEDAAASLFGNGIEIMSNKPVFLASTVSIDASSVDTLTNNALTVGGVAYLCTSIEPDGTGLTIIELIEA